MSRVVAGLALGLLVPVGASEARAQGLKQVKVAFEFHQSGTQSRDAVQGSGRVIITDRRSPRHPGSSPGAAVSGRFEVESTRREVRNTTGLFTIVQDGGEATLLVASRIPYPQIGYYRDYLTGAGYLATGVAFTDVGTSLQVRATVLPGDQVKVRVTPTVSWLAPGRSGVVEVTEASTELIVPNRRPIVMGGTTAQLNELTRRILGFAASQGGEETQMTLTVTVLE